MLDIVYMGGIVLVAVFGEHLPGYPVHWHISEAARIVEVNVV
jgi:hypothetical protein